MSSHIGRLWEEAVRRPLERVDSVDFGAPAPAMCKRKKAIPKLLQREYPQQRKIICQQHEGNLQRPASCQHSGVVRVHPGLASWGILSRPCGTGPSLSSTPRTTPDFLHATLDRSAYAAFFTESRTRLLDSIKLHRKSGSVLGYSQPSRRDWFRYTLIAALFSESAVQIARSKKANLEKPVAEMSPKGGQIRCVYMGTVPFPSEGSSL
jgi:hypothetical protein